MIMVRGPATYNKLMAYGMIGAGYDGQAFGAEYRMRGQTKQPLQAHVEGDVAEKWPEPKHLTSAGEATTDAEVNSIISCRSFLRPSEEQQVRVVLDGGSLDEGNARFQAIARRIRHSRSLRPDRSTYSALNLDTVRTATPATRCSDLSAKAVDFKTLTTEAAAKRASLAGKWLVRSTSSDKTSAPTSDEEVSDSSRGSFTCLSNLAGLVVTQWDSIQPIPFRPSISTDSAAAQAPTVSTARILSNRRFLLGYRTLAETPVDEVILKKLQVARLPDASSATTAPAFSSSKRPSVDEPMTPSGRPPFLCPSEKAYRVRAYSSDHLANFERSMRSLLNKVCPENVATVAEKVSAVKIESAEELHCMIQLLFKKALAEPHYCETYADLVFALKSAFQEFPSPKGGKPVTFRSSLLNAVQAEFEDLQAASITMPDTSGAARRDSHELEQARKSRALANMKFVGHLFLRHLLPVRVVGSLVRALLLCDDTEHTPSVVAVQCACELLMAVGYTLEASALPIARQALQESCARLSQLQRGGAYCKRLQFVVQDVLDARGNGWTRKLFKSSAKTMEEVRLEQQRELSSHGAGSHGVEHVVAGQRPTYLTAHM